MEINKSKDKIYVSARIRPMNEEEQLEDNMNIVEKRGIDKILFKNKENRNLDKELIFNSVFDDNDCQSDIFENTATNVLDGLFLGLNGTILSYGQTGTGKTYTMFGNVNNRFDKGIIPRSFDYIFDKIKLDKRNRFNLFLSSLQIYLETVYDLLEPKNTQIRIREDSDNNNKMTIEGTQWVKVTSTTECLSALKVAEKNKLKMEYDSANVHEVVILRVESSMVSRTQNEVNYKSTLFMVDLAGSEKGKKIKSNTLIIEELMKLNYSLIVLGKCLSKSIHSNNPSLQIYNNYGNNQTTYRNSKLTRLLQEPLKGNSRISMIITLSPSQLKVENTLSDLYFGQMAMEFEINPHSLLNKEVNYESLSNQLQEDLDNLNDEYTKLRKAFDNLNEENMKTKDAVFTLEKQMILSNMNNYCENHHDESEFNKLEEFYEHKLIAQEEEHHFLLCEIDKVLIEKEQLMVTINEENKNLKIENEKLNTVLVEIVFEKDELVKKLIQLESYGNMETDLINKNNRVDNNNFPPNKNLFRKQNSGKIFFADAEIQTESEILDSELLEILKNIGRKGKSLSENFNFKDNNAVYKLEYFISRFEKEIFRLNKENKEFKEKLKKNEENIDYKTKDILSDNTHSKFIGNKNLNYILAKQDEINLEAIEPVTVLLKQSKIDFKESKIKFLNLNVEKTSQYDIKKSYFEKKEAGVMTLINNKIKLFDNLQVKSIDFFIEGRKFCDCYYSNSNSNKPKANSKSHKITISTNNNDEESDDENCSEDLEQSTKILELNNEILKLKSLLFKKNKQIQKYEKIKEKHKLLEKELLVTKNDLITISNCIKDTRSSKNSNDRLSSMSNYGSIENRSTNPVPYKVLKYEYEEKVRLLNSTIDKLQEKCKSKQTDLENSKLIENKLKKKIIEMNTHMTELQKQSIEKDKNIIEVKEFYKLQLEKAIFKTNSKKIFLKQFTNFMSNNLTAIETIKDYFGVFTSENKKTYLSELFESDMDFENLDINNYNIFLQKINDLNYIIKLDEQLNFDWLFYNQFSLSSSENNFFNSYNSFMKYLLSLFEILLKTLITENTKIFYLTSNLNKLIKTVILSQYDNLSLNNQLNLINTKESNENKSNNSQLISYNHKYNNNISSDYEAINSKLKQEREYFEREFEKKNFDYRVIWINDESISNQNNINNSENRNINCEVTNFTCKVSDNPVNMYFKTTKSFFTKIEEILKRTNSE